ncbi:MULTISPECIES: hypothetical protein [unclassified Bradyrhizobium]
MANGPVFVSPAGQGFDVFAIYAISDIMVAYPKWADSGLRWFEIFDRVDIAAAQRQAKLNRDVVPQRYGVASVLFNELRRQFEPPAPAKRDKKAEAAAARATTDAARLAHIERRIDLGASWRRCAMPRQIISASGGLFASNSIFTTPCSSPR